MQAAYAYWQIYSARSTELDNAAPGCMERPDYANTITALPYANIMEAITNL